MFHWLKGYTEAPEVIIEVLPDLRINLRKVFDMENYNESANESRPGYSIKSKENKL